jgi:hypothetical protein
MTIQTRSRGKGIAPFDAHVFFRWRAPWMVPIG